MAHNLESFLLLKRARREASPVTNPQLPASMLYSKSTRYNYTAMRSESNAQEPALPLGFVSPGFASATFASAGFASVGFEPISPSLLMYVPTPVMLFRK
jgi:hypothetical protein